jgi:SAM-dependent methyltransferase
LPPPEVQETAGSLAPGRALDLGSGYGRAAIYLAARGWQVDGVEFVEDAVDEARRRASQAGVSARFHLAPVTDLNFLTPPYDLALDVGCLHSLDDAGLAAYHAGLIRLLRPGDTFLLFARLSGSGEAQERGIEERRLAERFGHGFSLERVKRGQTVMAGGESWPSAWFWFIRHQE